MAKYMCQNFIGKISIETSVIYGAITKNNVLVSNLTHLI